jgi:hypothetical protein
MIAIGSTFRTDEPHLYELLAEGGKLGPSGKVRAIQSTVSLVVGAAMMAMPRISATALKHCHAIVVPRNSREEAAT